MPNYAPDQLVKLSDGRVMTWAAFQQLVNQYVADFSKQMTIIIEQLTRLEGEFYSHSSDVWTALSQLQADMAGIEGTFGDDDLGKQIRAGWKQSWPAMQTIIKNVTANLDAMAANVHACADSALTAEESTFQGLNTKLGFNFQATDPRVIPSSSRPGHAF